MSRYPLEMRCPNCDSDEIIRWECIHCHSYQKIDKEGYISCSDVNCERSRYPPFIGDMIFSCRYDHNYKSFDKGGLNKQYLIKLCLALNDSLSFLSRDEKAKLFEKILFR